MTIEVNAKTKDTKIKIALGVIGCITLIILAAMFQTVAILVLTLLVLFISLSNLSI